MRISKMKVIARVAIVSALLLSNGVAAVALINADSSKVEGVSSQAPQHLIDDKDAAANELNNKTQELEQAKAEEKEISSNLSNAKARESQLMQLATKASIDDDLLSNVRANIYKYESALKKSVEIIASISSKKKAAEQKLIDVKNTIFAIEAGCVPKSGGTKFCRLTPKDKKDVFADLAISPTLADGGEIKLGVIRAEADLGDTVKIPFAILIADVTSQTHVSEANALKLLDPEQGINIGAEYAWRYRIFDVCAGEKTTARCVLGLNFGGRYLKLQSDGEEDSKATYGVFSSIQTVWAFNIFEEGNQENKLGTIRLHGAYSYFYHDGKSSDEFFPGITDGDGNPAKFEQNFGSLKYGASIYISKSINFTYSKFSASGNNNIPDSETISLNFDVLQFK